jgi:glyoxylase-like metal-dependent hydrolase (beta-lactamase superfamily II)
MTRLQTIRTSIANFYIIADARPVVVDTGNPGNTALILSELAALGFAPKDLALILLTHGHLDHLGSADELRRATGAPVALHRADLEMVRSGYQPLRPTGLDGRLLKRYFPTNFQSLEPDIVLTGEGNLHSYGVEADILETPGHTPGSLSVRLSDGQCLIADLVRGSFIAQNRPARHLFAEDMNRVQRSIGKLLTLPVTRLHPGHGHAFGKADLARRFGGAISPVQQR